MNHLPFEDAREFVHRLGLKKQKEWREYCKSGRKTSDIPTHPERAYKDQWISWGDWFGTGTIATFNRKYLDFETARTHVRALKLINIEQWNEYSKSGFKPPNVPYHPERTYKKEWKDWADWFGYDDPTWSLRRVKELLTDLIKSRVIYEWDEAVLYSLLLRKVLLNLHENNRHRQFVWNHLFCWFQVSLVAVGTELYDHC